MKGARVRLASDAELEVINRLQRQILPLDALADTSTGYWWLARDAAGYPVGFAGMVPSSTWRDAVYLCRAGVLVRARGQGLQRRLIDARLRKARAVGKNWAITDTNDNPASANSLIRAGFRMYSPAKPWADVGASYWRKKLT